MKPVKSTRSEPALSSRQSVAEAAAAATSVTRSQSARTSSSTTRRQSTRKYVSGLRPIFGEEEESQEAAGPAAAGQAGRTEDDQSMHQLGDFKPKRYSAKAKPKTRKAE